MARPRHLLLAAALGLCGCSRGFFSATGAVQSVGPKRIDNWRSTPQGCIRTTTDDPRELLTFLWEDPGRREPRLDNRDTAPDAPMRLSFSSAQPVTATLETLRHAGIPLDAKSCTVLSLKTQENAPAGGPESRPTLAGEFQLDCHAQGNQLTARVSFARCGY